MLELTGAPPTPTLRKRDEEHGFSNRLFVRTVCTLCLCIVTSSAASAELRFEVAWKATTGGGFSAPNVLCDPATGKTTAIVATGGDTGVVCFDPRGKQLWAYPMVSPVTAAVAVADIDSDGREEIIAADSVGNLVALSPDGGLLWSARLPDRVMAYSCPAIADLNGDGKPEVLVGDNSGVLSCLDATGSFCWQFMGDGSQMGPPLVADIYDTDGLEIIVTSHDRHIYALTAEGEWIWDLYFEDDLFPNSTPILADANGDDIPELHVGGGLHHYYRIDLRSHRPEMVENVVVSINHGIAAADINRDGDDEIVFNNMSVDCYGAGGLEWTRSFPRGSMVAAPTFLNLDEDPELEMLLISLRGDLRVLDTDGSVLHESRAQYTATVAPLVGDLDGDGMLELIGSQAGGGKDGGPLLWAELNVPCGEDVNMPSMFAGNRARSGRPRGAKSYPLLATPAATTEAGNATRSSDGDLALLSGPNTWRFNVSNPNQRRLALLTDLRYPDGLVRRFVRHVHGVTGKTSLSFDIVESGTYDTASRLVDADTLGVHESGEKRIQFDGLEGDKRYFNNVLFAATERAVEAWRAENPERAAFFTGELVSLRGTLEGVAGMGDADRAKFTGTLRDRAERLRTLAEAALALAPSGSFMAWAACPWAYFDPHSSLPTPDDRTESLSAALCQGEYESLAMNLTNVSEKTLDVRVFCDGIETEGGEAVAVANPIEFRRAVTVSTYRRSSVADPLPRLGQGNIISISSLESQQLWITVHAKDLPPGRYVAKLRLKSLEADPTEVRIPLALTVHDLAMPRPRPLRFCMWAYDGGEMGTKNPEILRELVEHGTTVFFAPSPKAECNAQGKLVGELDFTEHDEVLSRLAPHGYILFLGPQGGLRGQPFLSDPWRKAFVEYLRAWVAHMKTIGMHDEWALYPYDEPTSQYDATLLNLVQVSQIVREADPSIKIYTDPTRGMTMESVEMLKGLIDIWCPSYELLTRLGDEMMPVLHEIATEVWYYDSPGRAKSLSCLGHYRRWIWYAWVQDMTGAGWWCFAHHGDADRWDGPNPTGDFFSTAYDSPHGLVTSKRWEATREAIEDYEYLFLLRQTIADAQARNVPAAELAEANELLKTLPAETEAALAKLDFRLPLSIDSVPLYKRTTADLQKARKRLVEACLRVKGL